MNRFVCLVALLFSITPFAAWAAPDTLPVEAALIYQKLLKKQPNYDYMIYSNTSLNDDPDKFGKMALIDEQRRMLEDMYEKIDKNTVVHQRKELKFVTADENNGAVEFSGLEADEPFLFDLTKQDVYGVFVRNARDIKKIAAPFRINELLASVAKGTSLPAELTLHPVAADTQPFIGKNKEEVRVIVADLVALRVLTRDGKRVIFEKRFSNWNPDPQEVPLLVPLLPETPETTPEQ